MRGGAVAEVRLSEGGVMLKAVVFDLDGVLIDSEPLMRLAFGVSYRQVVGDGEPPIEAYLEHMGESFPRIMEKLALPYALWAPFREFCQRHIDQIRLFPESRGLVELARSLDLQTAILTGKDRERTLQILQYFDLVRLFDVVVASDELRSPKPDPEGMLYTLGLLGCAADQAVMVGDAVSDVLCAQRAGVPAIAVTWGIKPERVRTLCQPDYIVDDWQMLAQVLAMLQRGAGPHLDARARAGAA